MFRKINIKSTNFAITSIRRFADECQKPYTKALIVGVYDPAPNGDGEFIFTETASKINEQSNGLLAKFIKGAGIRLGTTQAYQNIHPEFKTIAVAGLGPKDPGYNEIEKLDECKESIRIAAGTAAKLLQDQVNSTDIYVEPFTNVEAAAEGASLSIWRYQDWRNDDMKKLNSSLHFFGPNELSESWERGLLKAEAQNIARKLCETPANLMTPTLFSKAALDILCPCGVLVQVHDKKWMADSGLTALIPMTQGSCEPPKFLEISYCGGNPDDKPVVLVGKGVTFNSGGLCLKKCENMSVSRGEMAGAAVIVSTMKAMAQFNYPINITALIPLCENMPGATAVKPTDVLLALNGKSIRVDNMDKFGRVVIAEALTYSHHYRPCMIVSLATLKPGIIRSLGTVATGAFSTSDTVFNDLEKAGAETGDRVWRLPFWKHYQNKITGHNDVDISNISKGTGAGPCTAAAFLKEFIPCGTDYLHLDITGTGLLASGVGFPYLREGFMTGRPTRTLIQLFAQMACPAQKNDLC